MADPIVRVLAEERQRQGLSQAEMGQRLGRHGSTVSAWERGVREPRLLELHRWADVLGFGAVAVVDREGNAVWPRDTSDEPERLA